MCFRSAVLLPGRDISAMVSALDQLSGAPAALPLRIVGGMRQVAADLRSSLAGCQSSDVLVECSKERALDIAAFLLDAASTLQLAGRPVAGFALEGVEGRLLESIVTGAPPSD